MRDEHPGTELPGSIGAAICATNNIETAGAGTLQPRAFQYEMLEESLRRNIIVASHLAYSSRTGEIPAGKGTNALNERVQSTSLTKLITFSQLVWFLAPGVALATQQEKVIASQMPAVQTRLLLGADGVEHWSEQWVWDQVLENIKIVVSTHQAISRTPKMHREELLRHVHLPALVTLTYDAGSKGEIQYPLLSSLRRTRIHLDIEQDPYVKMLKSDPTSCNSAELKRVKLSRKTYCQEQLKSLYTRAELVEHELGPWGSYWYIIACIQKLQLGVRNGFTGLEYLDDTEKVYLEICLSELLSSISEEALPTIDDACLSAKILRLIEFLIDEQIPGFTGLIFVRTRAEVAVLAELLSVHPSVKDFYAVSTFVGESNSTNRKTSIAELVDVRGQVNTLEDLRLGRKNLVVTTSALEEGIDVSACNVVICFDKPTNLKSLIQRRGRARKSESKFALMLADHDDPSTVATWRHLEQEMRRLYEDDMRRLRELEELEALDEGNREFVVEKTGAKLLLSDAVSHLYHFCATLPSRQLSSPAPIFEYTDTSNGVGQSAITAKVILPISVDISVREASGRFVWITEKNAKRDAAFEAYIQLYNAGLISNNLLPIRGYDEDIADIKTEVGKIPSLIQAAGQLNAWYLVAPQWQGIEDTSGLCCYDVSLHRDGDHGQEVILHPGDEAVAPVQMPSLSHDNVSLHRDSDEQAIAIMQMLIPCRLPSIPPITLYWDASTKFTTNIRPSSPAALRPMHINSAVQSTKVLLSSVFRSRMNADTSDFIALFTPSGDEHPTQWAEQFNGTTKGVDVSALPPSQLGLIRDLTHGGAPHILRGFEKDEFFLHVSRFQKRTDFLHPVPTYGQKVPNGHNKILLKPEDCKIDRLPLPYVYFAAIVPSVLHRISVRLIASHLCETLLVPVAFSQLDLVVTAITATSAQEPTNYQRLEFLGDSVLKFLTSITITSEHLLWHEGILSKKKDHIVSNASLAKAALEVGLDTFIQTKPFTGFKWRPLHVSDHVKSLSEEPRELSTKTLADVVEALVGAAFLDGGFDKAIAALRIFLPWVCWSRVDDRNEILISTYETSINYPHHFSQLEQLVGYNFSLKTLPLEALTHSSTPSIGSNVTASYERLEFLGDVCLDIIVSTTSFSHEPPIPTHELHLIRTAVVNANFLAFLCLTHSMLVTRTNIITEGKGKITSYETSVQKYIWQFMRQGAPAIRKAQQDCLKRYESLRAPVLSILQHGSHIPWSLLARLDAPKFFSDIIESTMGAIYIDSHGSLAACEAFLERLGVMGYLRRLLEGGVALYHPKEELGQLADTESVRYEVSREDEGEGEEKRLRCVVWIGEREVVRVGDGLCVLEVETRAAEEAVRLLKEERGRV
ncbi:MAG: hypothetical protein Q9166_001351 [cf. Caloplaca sp. 2 TL-2023]